MSSAPNHGASSVPGTELSRKTSPVLSLTGQARTILGHVRVENLVAGLAGGVASTLALHPLDLVKIRFAGTSSHPCVQISDASPKSVSNAPVPHV